MLLTIGSSAVLVIDLILIAVILGAMVVTGVISVGLVGFVTLWYTMVITLPGVTVFLVDLVVTIADFFLVVSAELLVCQHCNLSTRSSSILVVVEVVSFRDSPF